MMMDTNEIIEVIPHRFPFLLVDKIIDMDLEKGTITGLKNVTINEHFFQGHFPGAPIMPGVLILEAIAQTGGVLFAKKMQTTRIAVLLNVKEAKFRTPVKPGDTLLLECEGLHFSSKGGKIRAVAKVENRVAAECEMAFALVDKEQI